MPLRDYQAAILQVLIDGQEHDKDELKKVGVQAVDPHAALAAHQRALKNDTMRLYEGLTTEQRLSKMSQQQVKGAKLQVGKAMAHLVSGGLMEVASHDSHGTRLTYRITDKGRARLAEGVAAGVCSTCGVTIDPDAEGVAKRVEGTVVNRSRLESGARGGSNSIVEVEELGIYWCAKCHRERSKKPTS